MQRADGFFAGSFFIRAESLILRRLRRGKFGRFFSAMAGMAA